MPILLSILLVGCRSSVDAVQTSQASTKTTADTPLNLSTIAPKSFMDGSLFPETSDFKVFDFSVSPDNDSSKVTINLEYQFGEKATNFLKDNKHKYYFVVEVPSDKTDLFVTKQTKPVEGPALTNDKSVVYGIQLIAQLKPNLSNDQIKELSNNPTNYALVIYEDPNHPAKIIYNVAKGLGLQ